MYKMNLFLIGFALLVVIAPNLSCKDKESILGGFKSYVENVVRNNKLVFEVNVKGNAEALRNVFMRETQQNIELLLAQYVDKFNDKAADMESIAHDAIAAASVKIGADIEVKRRCIIMKIIGAISNIVQKVIFAVIKPTPARQKVAPPKKQTHLVGKPRCIKPKVDALPKDYTGYARQEDGYPVLIVGPKDCSPSYVEAYDESLKDLITDEVNAYVAHYKYKAKLKSNINQFLPTLKARCKKYTDKCLKKLEKCEDVCDAIEIVLDNSDRKLEEIVEESAEKY